MPLSTRDIHIAMRAGAQAQAQMRQQTAMPELTATFARLAETRANMRRLTAMPELVSMSARLPAERRLTAMTGLTAALTQFEKTQTRMARLTAMPELTATFARLAGTQERLRQIQLSLGGALRTREWLREWEAEERQILELLAPRGWLISPTTSFAEVREFLALAENEGVEAVEQALILGFAPARCREIIEGLSDRQSFAVWEDVLDQALSAHEQRRYALSVPVWLIVFDGIWFSECGISNIFTRATKKHGLVVRKAFPSDRDRLLTALIRVIAIVAENIAHGSGPALNGLRRHAVMHGLDPCYGTEKASLQGILMLEALHYHLDRRDWADDQ